MTPGMTDAAAQSLLNEFNRLYKPGSPAILILDFGKVAHTHTVGPAHLFSGRLMVSLHGYGKYRLDRVIPKLKEPAICTWALDKYIWRTGCGNTLPYTSWVHKWRFCPFCGNGVVADEHK